VKRPSYILVLGLVLMPPCVRSAEAAPITLSAVGTAIIDGSLSASEWGSAGYFDFIVNTPYGGTTPGRLFAMNDEDSAYFGLRFVRSAADPGNTFAIEFDNDGNGAITDGDDGIILNPSVGFVDLFRSSGFSCPPSMLCSFSDTEIGGARDGAGAFANDGTYTIYEFSHPLNSGDSFDFSLAAGDTIGMAPSIRMIAAGGTYPSGFGDTDLRFGVVEFAVASVPEPIPEPASLLLFGTGLVGLRAWRKRGQ